MGDTTERFSSRLKEIRETAGLTQAQLASELKVSRGAISYYEKGERTPDIEFLDSLSMYFDLPLDFVMGYTDNIKKEHRDMYEFYGLSDSACDYLEFHTDVGHLVSAIFEHKDFYALIRLYEGVFENYKTFNTSQMGYISFLISDLLNKIIFDSLSVLYEIQFTLEERETLRIKNEISLKKIEKELQEWEKQEEQWRKELEKEVEKLSKLDKAENAVRHSAVEKVHEKFQETIHPAEFRREHQ